MLFHDNGSEQRATDVAYRVVEVWMVEDIVELETNSKLRLLPLRDHVVLFQKEKSLLESQSHTVVIAPHIPQSRAGSRKCAGVEARGARGSPAPSNITGAAPVAVASTRWRGRVASAERLPVIRSFQSSVVAKSTMLKGSPLRARTVPDTVQPLKRAFGPCPR